jgi:hypothetical protein
MIAKTELRKIEIFRRVVKKMFELSDDQAIRFTKDVFGLTSQEIIELFGIWIE